MEERDREGSCSVGDGYVSWTRDSGELYLHNQDGSNVGSSVPGLLVLILIVLSEEKIV